MERIKKEELTGNSKIHIIYGSIIMLMSISFTITLLTMKETYKSAAGSMPEMPSAMVQGDAKNMQAPTAKDPNMPPGGAGGMPPFVKQMVQKYKTALEKNPKDIEALTGLGNMYYDSGQYPKAIDNYLKIVEIEPKNTNVQSDLGTSYFYTNDFKNAEIHLKKAIEADGKNLNALYNLGVVFRDQGKKDEAKKYWEQMKPLVQGDEQKKKLEDEINKLK